MIFKQMTPSEYRSREEDRRELWQTYWQAPSDENRNALVVSYLPVAIITAKRIAEKLRTCVDVFDLTQFGSMELIRAIKAYDPKRNVRFQTYAILRITGAIYDGLRNTCPRSRLAVSRIKMLDRATDTLVSELGRKPTDEEIADALGWSMQDYREWSRHPNINETSLNSTVKKAGGPFNKPTQMANLLEAKPVDQCNHLDAQGIIDSILKFDTVTDALVFRLKYLEGLTHDEIGGAIKRCGSLITLRINRMIPVLRDRFAVEV